MLKAHLAPLRRSGEMQLFSDTLLAPDTEREKKIAKALDQAPVAVLFISRNFLASEFIRNVELPRLLQRQQNEEVSLVPIILEQCDWRNVQELSELSMLPADDRPLTSLHSWRSDQAFDEIANKIEEFLQRGSFKGGMLASREYVFEESNALSGDFLMQRSHRTVLILRSFGGGARDSYEKLAAVLQVHDLKVMRIYDAAFQGAFSDPIREAIRRADVILCDLSGGSHNVYYELGMAHAMRKPTVLIVERHSNDVIPTDLQGFLFWSYELSQPKSLDRVARRVLTALSEQEASIDA